MKETKLLELVTGTEMKPWLSRNMLNTCENGWSNFSANLRVVSLKLPELTQFAWPNLSIYFNFLCAVPRDDVVESARFLMRPVIIPPWLYPLCVHRIIKVNSILYQKFALWTYSPFRHEVSLLYFNRNNLLTVLTYVCRHCNIKCF